jgi:PKD repeat protein
MDTKKLLHKLERDPAYLFLVCMALVCPLMIVMFSSGCKRENNNFIGFVNGSEAQPAVPVASFSVDVTDGPAPQEVVFQNESEGEVETVAWDFGDGTVSDELNPVHIYSAPGDYTVTFTVSGPGGEDQISHENLIRIRVPQVDMAVTDLIAESFRVRAGSYVEFTAMLENLGINNAQNCRIQLFLSPDSILSDDDMEVYDGIVENIPAGETIQVSLASQISSLTPVGHYRPILLVSAPESATDTDESNNVFTPGFFVTVCNIIKIPPCADTFISCDSLYGMYGYLPVLLASVMYEGVEFNVIQMAFDLDSIYFGSDVTIASAKLRLYTMSTTGETDNNLEVYAIEEEWSENSCCWENGPIHEPRMWASGSAHEIGWTEFDLTELTCNWLSGFVRNNGITLYTMVDETTYSFYSREYEDAHFRPHLEIELEPDMQ